MTRRYLIIGNGAAGLSAAEIIRSRDSGGDITIVSGEPYPLYSRPGIAYFILNQVTDKQLFSRTPAYYEEHRLGLVQGWVTDLSLKEQRAYLADGRHYDYDVLLVASGASAVKPTFPGHELDGVVTFDTLDDARDVVDKAGRARTAIVVGGGITAMELAEGIRHHRTRTLLLQRRERIWPRLLTPAESTIIAHAVAEEGIDVRYDSEVEAVLGKRGKVEAAVLKDGSQIACQLVGVAIGVRPNLGLIHEKDVATDRGILVDDYLRSSQQTLFAAGDVAQILDRWTGSHLLDILWPSAINEGRAAGHNMVDVAHGRPPSHAYRKGSPFNAALLFGVHLTVIGRVGLSADSERTVQQTQFSRGSSQVWTLPFAVNYRSAWDAQATSSIRIVMVDGRVQGALLLGNQELADPLRQLIENQVDCSRHEKRLMSEANGLPQAILQAWRDWHETW